MQRMVKYNIEIIEWSMLWVDGETLSNLIKK